MVNTSEYLSVLNFLKIILIHTMKQPNFSLFIVLVLLVGCQASFLTRQLQANDLAQFRSDELASHNSYRALHFATPLVLNGTLNAAAQDWAQHLSDSGLFYHQNAGYGENLYKATKRSAPLTPAQYQLYVQYFGEQVANQQNPLAAGDATDSWYSEEVNYDYVTGSSSNGGVVGHFTQLVWDGSTQVGFGKVSKPTSDPDLIETFVVAFYSPPGNDVNMLPGQSYQQAKIQAYTSNVFAPS